METEKNETSVVVVEKEDIKSEIKNELDYNEVLTHIGQFGKWQKKIFFWFGKTKIDFISNSYWIC